MDVKTTFTKQEIQEAMAAYASAKLDQDVSPDQITVGTTKSWIGHGPHETRVCVVDIYAQTSQ